MNPENYQKMKDVLGEVSEERVRQECLWGEQNHPMGTGAEVNLFGYQIKDLLDFVTSFNDDNDNPFWGTILLEEVLEALIEPEGSPDLRKELTQVAAVAVAAIEDLDRRNHDS